MKLKDDICRCKGTTDNGFNCHMKQNCLRYLSYTLDDEVYVPVMNAPNCIEHTPIQCPMKLTAHIEK